MLRSRQQSEEASSPPSSPLDTIPEERLRPSRPNSVAATPSAARRVSYQSASHFTPRQRETTPVESRIPRVSPTGLTTPARPAPRNIVPGSVSRPGIVRGTPARPIPTTVLNVPRPVGGLAGLATPKSQPVTQPLGLDEDEPRERMVMTRMILENFKSYAGTVEIGPFHKSFTSIVGPNGSGKSNVIDALQFVFGFGAKAMRHDKVAHLIHNSSTHPHLDHAKVELHFHYIVDGDTPDEFTVVPNSSFTMSRTVTKSGGGGYKLNGKTITHGDLRTFLKSKGVDLDQKRFLILQGEVEQIAQMKPKGQTEGETGLLEYLEDIIGTAHFKELIEAKQKDLEAANETRTQHLDRVKAAEKEKGALEGKKKEAEDYLKAENELVRQKNKLYQVRKRQAETQVESLEQQIGKYDEQLKAEKAKYKDIQTEVEEAESAYGKLAKEYEALGVKINEATRELQKFEKEDIRLQENRKHLKNKGKKLLKSLESDKHTLVELESTLKNCDADFEKFSVELEKLTENKTREEAELERIRDSMKGKTEEIQTQLEQKQKELAPWSSKINEKQAEIDLAQSEFELLSDRVNSVGNKLEQAKTNLATLMENFAPKEEELAHLTKRRGKLVNKKKVIEDTMANALKDEERLRSSAQALRQRADEARASKEADKSKGNVIKMLLRERDSGRLRGVHGRLGDLGIIDDKYDVAISTACPQLDQIVVEDVETAQKCIELLRQKNLGRASFIVLNKMNPVDTSAFSSPENAPRLFDLVRPKDSKYAPAFYFALQNTLVANDLSQANRIAYGKQRWRVVTLDGQLIDKSGTMSGGGNRVIRGLMSSKFAGDSVSDKEIETLEASREGEESRLRQLVAIRKEMEGELEQLTNEIPQLDVRISKLEMELKSDREQVSDLEGQISDLSAQKPDDKDVARMSEIRRTMLKLQQEMEPLRSASRSIEVQIKELQDKILEVGGVRLRSQKAKVDSISEQMDFVSDRVTKARVGKVAAEKNMEKTLKNVEKIEKDLVDCEAQIEEVRREMDSKTLVAVDVKKRLDEMSESHSDKKQKLEDLKQLVDERTEQISKFRSVEQELRMKLGDKVKEQGNQRKILSRFQDLLSHLKLNQYDIEDEPENETLTVYTAEQLEGENPDHIQKTVEALESKLEKSQPNLGVLEEFKRCFKEYITKVEQLKNATKLRDEIKESYDDLRKQRLDKFMSGFTAISQRLKEMYQMITLGGNAELELVDSLDPFSEGILFSVMPPKKSWKNISNLSGGEKTLSSLALVFALHHFKPTPIYVMDEIDAALDFRNVSIVANYIKERTKMAQFVIISLRNNMFELADRLVGIYKTDNCTKTIAINPTLIAQDVR